MLLLIMMHQFQIETLANEIKIAPLNIIREYLEMEVLHYLSQSKLSENIIFYGGTALRLAYNSFRFSEDLDFLFVKETNEDERQLNKVLMQVAKNNQGVRIEEIINKRATLFGLLRIKHDLLKHPIRIKIEICKKKNGIKSENSLLTSPVSNKEIIFHTADMESIFKSKKRAIQDRSTARDWFDFWYLANKLKKEEKINKEFPFNRKDFTNELKRWLPRNKWKILDTVINFYEN